ncbi:ATP-binding protein [Ruixingdingia sedimenti]|uniref:ATP-binding protein n=1 Tax=Ruixingdingia sedimenti TaxID=3073604 RepID=A0ABU1F6B3_9RHOB|nr:ATP-binding protein [Xinfangfangia sp. LG-4]MDR5652414.1 ATP-binding protein [Xinfangfangia sp. LG-4]
MPARTGAQPACPRRLRLVFPADPLAVRQALHDLHEGLRDCPVSPQCRATMELVLAEVLNNVVEHAYADRGGEIEICVQRSGGGLVCCVADSGRPMPHGALPPGDLPGTDAADLPEGGFGWHLIRALSRDLDYRREGTRNLLRFHLPAM